MIQSKNLKLKLGLCGLALTSFLALNARSNTVHADTVSGSNASAITWDNDQDDSQVVKEEPQQDNASQSVQSNVQKCAETSTVRASNFDSRAVNQVRVNNARPQAKVANVNATVKDAPVQITNPQNDQVIVHYVKSNGKSAGLANQTIDVTKVGKGQYAVPSGYVLANNGYTNSTAEIEQASVTAGRNNVKLNQVTAEKLANMLAPKINDAHVGVYLSTAYAGDGHNDDGPDGASQPVIGLYVTIYKSMKSSQGVRFPFRSTAPESIGAYDVGYTFLSDFPTQDQYRHFIPFIGNRELEPFTTNNIRETEVSADEYSQHVDSIPRDNAVRNLQREIASGDGTYSRLTEDDCVNILNWLQASFDGVNDDENGGWVPGATPTLEKEIKMSNTTSAPVFTDNSGQVKSVVGNHVNIVVTKPQNVDPNSSDCRRQAQRIIHVTFPNGVKPKSYDSIEDSEHNKFTLNGNNDLVQTVTFTRSMTVDGLTGATLNQTSWQQHGAINAVTLPDIPGYTMVQSK